ncbi:hypothetical protein CMI47_11245 [Candidatus Pacearchaeota archaeon]|nr:hypothetical protein [Candidatus Pacearchaeota archaeon]|tara:strand:- start:3343 stop:3690 length:348 start_codon:yes stop_codon:yes gene_type:complete
MRNSNHILVLIALDKYRSDLLGNVFPYDGIVVAESFCGDREVTNGLIGSLNGENEHFQHPKPKNWVVVRVHKDDAVHIESTIIKFHKGFVLEYGTKKKTMRCIKSRLEDPLHAYR